MVEWKIKGLFKADPQDVYDEITSIGDEVTPAQIVEKARDKDTALHDCFEWNNKKAADKYRLSQAQMIIRNIVQVADYKDDDGNDRQCVVRAIVCKNENKNTYETISRCVSNPDSFARLQASLMKDLTIFKQRYERYNSIRSEYADLFDAINNVVV